jgi:hypothetical protein
MPTLREHLASLEVNCTVPLINPTEAEFERRERFRQAYIRTLQEICEEAPHGEEATDRVRQRIEQLRGQYPEYMHEMLNGEDIETIRGEGWSWIVDISLKKHALQFTRYGEE